MGQERIVRVDMMKLIMHMLESVKKKPIIYN